MSDKVEGEYLTASTKWFNLTKGFGFLQLPGGGLDVFVHANALRKSGITAPLVEGQKVRFMLESGPKGSFASNISLVTD